MLRDVMPCSALITAHRYGKYTTQNHNLHGLSHNNEKHNKNGFGCERIEIYSFCKSASDKLKIEKYNSIMKSSNSAISIKITIHESGNYLWLLLFHLLIWNEIELHFSHFNILSQLEQSAGFVVQKSHPTKIWNSFHFESVPMSRAIAIFGVFIESDHPIGLGRTNWHGLHASNIRTEMQKIALKFDNKPHWFWCCARRLRTHSKQDQKFDWNRFDGGEKIESKRRNHLNKFERSAQYKTIRKLIEIWVFCVFSEKKKIIEKEKRVKSAYNVNECTNEHPYVFDIYFIAVNVVQMPNAQSREWHDQRVLCVLAIKQ